MATKESGGATAQDIAAAGPDAVVGRIDAFLGDRRLTREQVAGVYDQWSGTYEADLERVPLGYNNPRHLTDAYIKQLETLSTDAANQRDQLRILDVACGTGLVGERLHELGFRHVDGLDGSQQMLETARRKSVYESLHAEFVGDQPLKSVPARAYDAVLTTGSFCPNHLAPSCLRHLAALVQPGGMVGIGMRKDFGITDPVLRDLEPEMARLEAEGVWRMLLREEQSCYYGEEPGMYYILRVN